eukprot:2774732-Pyramimonas_sp.AAC.1
MALAKRVPALRPWTTLRDGRKARVDAPSWLSERAATHCSSSRYSTCGGNSSASAQEASGAHSMES